MRGSAPWRRRVSTMSGNGSTTAKCNGKSPLLSAISSRPEIFKGGGGKEEEEMEGRVEEKGREEEGREACGYCMSIWVPYRP